MLTPTIQKIVVAVVVVLALAFFGYRVFTKEPDPSLVALDPGAIVVGQDVLALVEKLKTISISQQIFSSPLYNNLRDFSIPITPEAQGRINPFGPIGL